MTKIAKTVSTHPTKEQFLWFFRKRTKLHTHTWRTAPWTISLHVRCTESSNIELTLLLPNFRSRLLVFPDAHIILNGRVTWSRWRSPEVIVPPEPSRQSWRHLGRCRCGAASCAGDQCSPCREKARAPKWQSARISKHASTHLKRGGTCVAIGEVGRCPIAAPFEKGTTSAMVPVSRVVPARFLIANPSCTTWCMMSTFGTSWKETLDTAMFGLVGVSR